MLINCDQLKKEEITSYLHKVRAVMFDKSGKLLVTDMNGSYNLPGGRMEGSERPKESLIREIKEETGVELHQQNIVFVGNYHFYHKNFPNGTNRDNEIDLYMVTNPVCLNYTQTNVTEYEKSYNFRIVPVSEEELENLFKESSNNVYKKFTDIELQVLFDEYKKYKGGNKNVREEI